MNWLRLPYSIYIIVVLFALLPLQVVIYIFIKLLIPYPKQIYWAHKANRMMFLIWSAFTGFRYKIRGVENIDPDQTYIVICNHSNLADLAASAYGIQVSAKPLVKKELLKIPLLGQLFAMASVPVDRKDEAARKKSMEVMRREIKQYISLIIFPEGTRNRTDQPLKAFHNGAFALSLETGTPILPVIFTNLRQMSSAESILLRPWTIEATHLPPVDPKNFDSNDLEGYKQAIFKMMWNYIVDHDREFAGREKM